MKPAEVREAETILALAQRFGQPPHEVDKWPLETVRWLLIEGMSRSD